MEPTSKMEQEISALKLELERRKIQEIAALKLEIERRKAQFAEEIQAKEEELAAKQLSLDAAKPYYRQKPREAVFTCFEITKAPMTLEEITDALKSGGMEIGKRNVAVTQGLGKLLDLGRLKTVAGGKVCPPWWGPKGEYTPPPPEYKQKEHNVPLTPEAKTLVQRLLKSRRKP